MAVIKISGAVAVLTLKYPCRDTAEGHGLRCHCREGRRTWAATAIKSLSVLTVLLPKGGRSKCQAHHQPTHLLSSSRRSVRRVRGRNLPCHCWRFRRATELTRGGCGGAWGNSPPGGGAVGYGVRGTSPIGGGGGGVRQYCEAGGRRAGQTGLQPAL